MRIAAADLLRTYANASLQQMARQWGLDTKRKNKEQFVRELAPRLYDPQEIRHALADLAPAERTLLDRLILAEGEAPTSLVRAQLEREGVIERPQPPDRNSYDSYYQTPTGSVRTRGSSKFEDLVARLGVLGLAFTAEPSDSYGTIVELGKPGRRLFIPEEILKHLPAVALRAQTVAPPATIQAGDAAPLLRDLYLLLSFVGREQVPLTARGVIAKRTLVRVAGELSRREDVAAVRSEDELAWLPLLRGLAEELGLLAPSVGELILAPRAAEFLRLPAGERRRRLFEAYRRTSHWCELYRIPELAISGKAGSLRLAPPGAVAARQRVLAELAGLPVAAWITLDHLIERIATRAYEFLLPRRWTPTYYGYGFGYGYGYQPSPYHGENELGLTFNIEESEQEGWNLVEAGFIRVIVTEALAALGIVDLGGEGKAVAFRITEDGARLLRGETPPSPASAPHVVVQPNFQVFAFEPTGEDVLFTLDQLADRVRAEQAIEYELTRDSIYRAQRAGLDAAGVLAFLERVSTVGVPQNVRRTIEEWGGQLERITLRRRAPLLHVADAAALDELYADPALAPLLGRRLAPTVALVASADLRKLSDRLVAGGRLPALTEGPDKQASPAPRLSVDVEGRITFRQRLPSIYDLSLLRPFAEEADGTMRLSPQSLRRGAKAACSADEIVATLERLHAGPLPPDVSAFVRRWAKDWGEGALFETALLQVDQAATLSDLLADPEVKPLLQAVPGAPTLALVRPESVPRLRALLDARGMALGDRLLR